MAIEKKYQRKQAEAAKANEEARERANDSLIKYQEQLTEIEIVRGGLLGEKPGFKTVYLWNVLSDEFTPQQIQEDARFSQLSEVARVAIAGNKDYQPLRAANVLPSKVAQLRAIYEQNGVVLDYVPVQGKDELFLADSSPESEVEVNPANLEVLIGGLEPYNDRLQVAQEAAVGARKYWNYDEDFESTFGFTFFDELKDKEAGTLLKDIVLARNACLGDNVGLVRGLELQAEPVEVMQRIVVNIHDTDLVRQITALDIQGAIESGALSCTSYTSQGTS